MYRVLVGKTHTEDDQWATAIPELYRDPKYMQNLTDTFSGAGMCL